MVEKKKLSPVFDAKGRRIARFYRYTGSQNIYIRVKFRKLGIPELFVCTGETTLGRAKTQAEILIQRHKNKHLGVDDTHVFGRRAGRTIAQIVDEILATHTPELRERTQEKHEYYLAEIKKHFGYYQPGSLTPELFKDWVKAQRKKAERNTFFDYAKHLNLVMRFAYEKKDITHQVSFENPDPKTNNSWRVYTQEELERLWAVMNETTRDQFILSYECFMRLREVLLLTWDRVDLETGKVTLRPEDVKTGSRTGRGREFIVSPTALERLRVRRVKVKGPWVFPSKKKDKAQWDNKTAWKLAKENAKILGKATWHSLRHTALTHALLVQRLNPTAVSEYAGVSIQTIQRVYLHGRAESTRDVSRALTVVRSWGENGVKGAAHA